MSTTRVHLTASILAAVLATVLFLTALMLGISGLTHTQGRDTYECGSAWNIGTTPDNRKPVTFTVFGPESGDYTYDGLTGCGDVKSSRSRLAIGAAVLGLLATAAALVESRRFKAERRWGGATGPGEWGGADEQREPST